LADKRKALALVSYRNVVQPDASVGSASNAPFRSGERTNPLLQRSCSIQKDYIVRADLGAVRLRPAQFAGPAKVAGYFERDAKQPFGTGQTYGAIPQRNTPQDGCIGM
jgi:hypothetical protein